MPVQNPSAERHTHPCCVNIVLAHSVIVYLGTIPLFVQVPRHHPFEGSGVLIHMTFFLIILLYFLASS